MRLLTLLVLAVTVTGTAVASERMRVVDGDTFKRGKTYLRIENLDAPDIGSHAKCELEAQRGARASAYARALVQQGKVSIVSNGRRDRYGRDLVRAQINGRDFAALMIEAGHGRPWRGRSSNWCR